MTWSRIGRVAAVMAIIIGSSVAVSGWAFHLNATLGQAAFVGFVAAFIAMMIAFMVD